MSAYKYRDENEFDLREIYYLVLKKKYFVGVLTLTFSLISVIYSLSLPNIYTSSSLLAPNIDNSSLSNKLSQVKSFASIGGFDIPNDNISKSDEAIARIQSFEFFKNHLLPKILLENLVAVQKWDSASGKIIFNTDIYNPLTQSWNYKSEFSINGRPSDQESFIFFKRHLTIEKDQDLLFVNISISHQSPIIAEKWLNIIINQINESMRSIDKLQAEKSIKFLNEYTQLTNIQSMKEVIAELLNSQMQSLMVSSSTDSFVYKVIDSPIAPEQKSAPNRTLICILGALIGFTLAIFVILLRYFSSENDNISDNKKC